MSAAGHPRDVVIVGASLAGLRAAEALRAEGFTGNLTLVGAEQHAPYDRPPLSKRFLTGSPLPPTPRSRSPTASGPAGGWGRLPSGSTRTAGSSPSPTAPASLTTAS